jgi:hypothetical protein
MKFIKYGTQSTHASGTSIRKPGVNTIPTCIPFPVICASKNTPSRTTGNTGIRSVYSEGDGEKFSISEGGTFTISKGGRKWRLTLFEVFDEELDPPHSTIPHKIPSKTSCNQLCLTSYYTSFYAAHL